MKTFKSLTILAAVAAVFAAVSCNKEEAPSANPETKISTITLSIVQPTDESATKTQLGDQDEETNLYPINWTKGDAHTDAIAVGTTSGNDVVKYTLTDGGGTMTGSFTGAEVTGAVKVFYPYDDVVSAADGVYNVSIPAVQTYASAASFGEDAMPMYAIASSTEALSSMKPLMSVLKITLSGSSTVKKIVVSNESEKLSGSATVTYSGSSASLEIDETNGNNSVELVCTDGVPLTSDGAVFHIVVPATTAALKYTVCVKTDNDVVLTTKKFTPNSKFTAATIKNLTNVLAVPTHEYVEIGEIKWATMNLGATTVAGSPSTCYGDYYAWGGTETFYSSIDIASQNSASFEWKDGYSDGYSSSHCPSVMGETLNATEDIATLSWGNGWRLPTYDEFQALVTACTGSYNSSISIPDISSSDPTGGIYWLASDQSCLSEYSGVCGILFVDNTDTSKRVFFPASGCCMNTNFYGGGSSCCFWLSSRENGFATESYYFSYQNKTLTLDTFYPYCGMTVRPVSD